MGKGPRNYHFNITERYTRGETAQSKLFDLFDEKNQIDDWSMSLFGEEDAD